MSMACDSHPSHEKTILRRAMATWCLEDITPPRTSQEAEETKEKWKRKVQIMFLAPSVKFRRPMLAFQFSEYLIRFWSYQACDYTITKPRTWPTCWSSSNGNWLSSHGDIHPAIQTFISLVTMELSWPRDSAEPRTPIEALPQSSRPLPTPPLHYSLFCSMEHGAFPLIVTMFPFTSGFYFFHSVLITYHALLPL